MFANAFANRSVSERVEEVPVQAKLFGVRISTTVLSGQENGRGVSRDDQRVRESGAAAFDELKVRVFQSPGALIRRDEKRAHLGHRRFEVRRRGTRGVHFLRHERVIQRCRVCFVSV